MSALEKELQQIEAQYGEEFGDASESEEELDADAAEKMSEEGPGQFCRFAGLHVVAMFVKLVIAVSTDAGQADTDQVPTEFYDDLYCPACNKSFKSDKA